MVVKCIYDDSFIETKKKNARVLFEHNGASIWAMLAMNIFHYPSATFSLLHFAWLHFAWLHLAIPSSIGV